MADIQEVVRDRSFTKILLSLPLNFLGLRAFWLFGIEGFLALIFFPEDTGLLSRS